ncbi:hypothetical protein [Singulisphaera sp. GP187]|uniref:hypothetical protein n=1 Tax=Singulisphaera sp. GP187 TaxID=1882752 RepID=UPI0020B11831|nr:hypothetical protein [Singulisphaera sp. GP187]
MCRSAGTRRDVAGANGGGEPTHTYTYTLTVPALLAASVVSVVVPGPRKAEAVLATLRGRSVKPAPPRH